MDLAGKPLTLRIRQATAEQAAGSRAGSICGDTVVMVNATMSPEPRPGVDFFPLAVDVEEKQYSVGKIPGGFIKRGRPSHRKGHPDLPPHRPSAAPALPQGNAQRRAASWRPCFPYDNGHAPPEIPAMIGSSIALCRLRNPLRRPHGLGGGGSGSTANSCINPDRGAERAESRHAPHGFAAPRTRS